MKKLIPLVIGLFFIAGCGNTVQNPAQNETTPPKIIENKVVPKAPMTVNKSGVSIILDSTKRPPEKYVDGPLSQADLDALKDKYIVEIASIPECGGDNLSNRYIAEIQNDKGYDYVTAWVRHEPLTASLQVKLDALRKQDEECNYIPRTPENKPAIDEMLKEYKDTYEQDDLEKIQKAIKEL